MAPCPYGTGAPLHFSSHYNLPQDNHHQQNLGHSFAMDSHPSELVANDYETFIGLQDNFHIPATETALDLPQHYLQLAPTPSSPVAVSDTTGPSNKTFACHHPTCGKSFSRKSELT